jgi:hypothetical protein
VRQYGNVALKLKRRAGADMKNTIIKKNLSIEDAKNVADELKIYSYKVEITVEGNRRTVTATREAQNDRI